MNSLFCTYVLIFTILSNSITQNVYLYPPPEETAIHSCQYILAAGTINSNWSIFIIDIKKGLIQSLTEGMADNQMPSLSPDARTIAFASQRSGNWDIYLLDTLTLEVVQLTNDPDYDGWPTWSPDGQQIAFESYRDGNLNIYKLTLHNREIQQITNSSYGDVEPIWIDQGKGIIYTSWETGYAQLYKLNLLTQKSIPLTKQTENPQNVSLSPDQRFIAYIDASENNNLIVRDTDGGGIKQISEITNANWPFWEAQPVTKTLPGLFALVPMQGGQYQYPDGWNIAMTGNGTVQRTRLSTAIPGHWQRPSCIAKGIRVPNRWQTLQMAMIRPAMSHIENLASLTDVDTLQPRLAADVIPSYQRLRQSVLQASGFDFLNSLNDAWRGLDHPTAGYLSWHKTGRAIDVKDWYKPADRNIVEIARENLDLKTYFRMYLRAAHQDGSQGMPIRKPLWTAVGRGKTQELAQKGGYQLIPPSGYYVDFTDLAFREGWQRIPALTPPDGDWKKYDRDLEFWHYERRDDLTWYEAMLLIFSEKDLQKRYTFCQVLRKGYPLEAIIAAGIPDATKLSLSSCQE